MQRPILNYHAVGETTIEDLKPWTISRSVFATHLDLLVDKGLRGVTLSEALSDPSPDQVVLTFDDGYEDFVLNAVPEMEVRGFRATVFVVTGDVGKECNWLEGGSRPMVSWDQLREASSAGFEVGSHTHTHRQLDLLRSAEVERELVNSRRILSEQLGQDVPGFCYPHGFHTRSIRRAAIDAGFSYSCAVKHRMSHLSDDVFALSRIVIAHDTDTAQLEGWLAGRNLRRRHLWVERPLAAGFRAYRWLRAARLGPTGQSLKGVFPLKRL